ncbi:response regulator transcription factor [Metapseudomonas otitidis]|jgi:transcriptional regulator EpsA|uniref:Helix-turn-helix transcriptional regulator n=1 Tax=Metapseudomonas otitidis TaxID=319939 RepID=A0ABU3XUZ7_9GAMM|nr:helix-turn-helix transcriptional regulator [Pseudomonas otitidis]MDV3441620.1 helix-turn-helix transcriptional regulator [Pseudomonas otitidis]WMR32790.1 helix-turn-helix transcriptional regulator [Pseudomonas otitidis]
MDKLTEQEQTLYLKLVMASQQVDSVEDFQGFVRECLRPLLPHGMTLACVGAFVNGKAVLEMAVAVDYPTALFEKVHEIVSIPDRALLARWYMERKPQLITRGLNDQQLSELERSEMEQFAFDNFVAHGLVDLDGKKGSYISLARVPGQLTDHHALLMELITPHLHQILVRLIASQNTRNAFSNAQLLSPKEQVVLRWLAAGKSNPEIAALLSRSVSTIRNQVHSILTKLGASTRAEALAKAYELRLL